MIGLAILYAFGTAWLMNYSKLDFSAAMAAAVLPFVPLDVLKAAACAAAAPAVRRALRLRVSAPRQSA
ncbi:MAG: biotin transporter BioY [Clostridiales bacterium]|jgi:biotin transport system substrate-specific component|nr:biotin transporter BioY [Clostridiales bacterium]